MALEAVAAEAGVDVACIKIIAKWESCLKKVGANLFGPYKCPANVSTQGIGTTVWPNGHPVRMSDPPITYERCEEVLAYDIGKRYAPAVDRAFTKWQHKNQRSACISFAYNVGTAGFSRSTLCYLMKQGKYERAADEFLKWTKGGGRTLRGLVNRRRDERQLFLTKPKDGDTAPPVVMAAPPAITITTAPGGAGAAVTAGTAAPQRTWWRTAWDWLS